ncbi:hypothetical protein [Streptomyces sp. PR69]|uniref:hypothetical protein n=1 Tax=Streptomyces sp. PR69 TaxID=2984950 RepID=UPI002264471D|nr:hypothetical protein [Streptomyces sp. PR69]
MFRRTFWFTAGAAAGVWATTKVNRKLRQLTPENLAAQAADKARHKAVETGQRLRDFALDVRTSMNQREAELGEALGLHTPVDAPPRARALPPQRTRAALEHSEPSQPQHPKKSYDRNEDH